MKESHHIFLDSLDGFQFEELCAEIYRRLGYEVQNVADVGDEGRDLILKTPDGKKIVAECKHWPGKPVGRPVVQKLHSAVVTLPAKQGMLLTTGYFPKSSRDYVAKLKQPIELVDLPKLKDLAAQAGITLTTTKDPAPVSRFLILESDGLKRLLDAWVFNRFDSAPASADKLLSVKGRSVDLKPMYLVRYSLRQDFSTSIGRIHRLQIPDAFLLIDAEDGAMEDAGVCTFMKGAAMEGVAESRSVATYTLQRTFKLGISEVREVADNHIVRVHRTSVGYWGRNNQYYELDCIPSKKNIFFKDTRQVYLPEQSVELEALKRKYKLDFVENGREFYWLGRPKLFECGSCGRSLSRCLLCNSCGAIACLTNPLPWWLPLIFSGVYFHLTHTHSFRCTLCSRTVCGRCVSWVRRWAFFTSPVCRESHVT